MYFDTHAHYDDDYFDEDRDELLASMPERGVSLILNPGCDRETSEIAMALADRYPYVYAAIGWHPGGLDDFDETSIPFLREAAKHPKVVAIGEIGLDYYYDEDRDLQKRAFEAQLQLAEELDLPVIIHDREAHGDCMEMLRKYPKIRGVFHCYSGSAEMARQLVKMGWYLSFTGVVTFKNARAVLEAVRAVPLDRIMLETDSPYLAPIPHRGKRNDSSNLPYIAEKIAELKEVSVEELIRITRENGMRFFGIEEG